MPGFVSAACSAAYSSRKPFVTVPVGFLTFYPAAARSVGEGCSSA